MLHHPVMNLSTWLEPRRDDYIDHLLQVSEDGDLGLAWIRFFAEGVREQAIASAQTGEPRADKQFKRTLVTPVVGKLVARGPSSRANSAT